MARWQPWRAPSGWGPIHTPFDGEIVEPNEEAFDADVLIANRDPYDLGWITLIRPDDTDRPHSPLVEGEEAATAYMERIDGLDISCFRCAD